MIISTDIPMDVLVYTPDAFVAKSKLAEKQKELRDLKKKKAGDRSPHSAGRRRQTADRRPQKERAARSVTRGLYSVFNPILLTFFPAVQV